MKKIPAVLLILALCTAAFLDKAAFGALKVATSETKAIACVFENKDSGYTEEIDRAAFTGIGGLWVIDDHCKKTAQTHARDKGILNWRHLCCPVTNDDKVHCESPLGSHGKWQ